MTRITDKIEQITTYLKELSSIIPTDFDEYNSDLTIRAACERYLEKIVEAATDLAFFAIKEKKLRLPEDDADAFNVLLENKIIDEQIASRLKSAKGMRNIIAHQYGAIDDSIVFEAVTQHLNKDVKEFLRMLEGRKKN